jgi:hypothetical protein
VDDDGDHGEDDEQVNQESAHMEDEEAACPEDDEDKGEKKHIRTALKTGVTA